VGVVVHIMSLLSDPRDVFATARTCLVAAAAARAPGAFPAVVLSTLDDQRDYSHLPPSVCDMTQPGGVAAWHADVPHATEHFAQYLIRTGAVAGVSLTLTHPQGRLVPTHTLCALVRGCTALQRLFLDVRRSQDAELVAEAEQSVLLAARDAPLEHVRLRSTSVAHLPPLADLRSLELFCDAPDGEEEEESPDVAAVEALCSRLPLTTLELHGRYAVYRIRSCTLCRLLLRGKAVAASVLDCPQLTDFSASDDFVRSSVKCWDMARALMLGCPRLDWRAEPTVDQVPVPWPLTLYARAHATKNWAPDMQAFHAQFPNWEDAEHVERWRRFLENGASTPAERERAAELGGDSASLRFASYACIRPHWHVKNGRIDGDSDTMF
jgi:hypothetical protein